jgi:hypothetical protein
MIPKAAPLATAPDPREPKQANPALLPEDDEGELTDEEAFYLAQEEAFADMRARYEAWPRRKL